MADISTISTNLLQDFCRFSPSLMRTSNQEGLKEMGLVELDEIRRLASGPPVSCRRWGWGWGLLFIDFHSRKWLIQNIHWNWNTLRQRWHLPAGIIPIWLLENPALWLWRFLFGESREIGWFLFIKFSKSIFDVIHRHISENKWLEPENEPKGEKNHF